jgi:hypothetical protein
MLQRIGGWQTAYAHTDTMIVENRNREFLKRWEDKTHPVPWVGRERGWRDERNSRVLTGLRFGIHTSAKFDSQKKKGVPPGAARL